MTTEQSSDSLVDSLVAALAPVRPRRAWRDGILVLVLALTELTLVLMFSRPRPDLLVAMHGPMFWWKMASCLALALTGGCRDGAGARSG